jgi:hypothetical protein
LHCTSLQLAHRRRFASIFFAKRILTEMMDCRVKPGNDGGKSASTTVGITVASGVQTLRLVDCTRTFIHPGSANLRAKTTANTSTAGFAS